MFSVGAQWLKNNDYKTPGEIAAVYDAVTLEQVNAIAQKFPLVENMTLCVGPKAELLAPV